MLGQFVDRRQKAALLARARDADQQWLDFDAATLRSGYNKQPFLLRHRLPLHPEFALDRLFALCHRLPPSEVRIRVGEIPEDAEFDGSLRKFNQGLALTDVEAGFEQSRAYIAVYNPERDPGFRPVIEQLLGEIAQAIEPFDPGLNWYSTYLFLSTGGSLTPYHMDREMNFLLQVRGRKTARLWDPADDEVMTPAQKDRLLADETDLRPQYRPDLEARAMRFALEPGLGLHHPFIAPHLIRTNDSLSISLAITFRTRRSDRWADAHKFNHRLRGLGMNPTPVQHSALLDAAKATMIRAGRPGRRLLAAVRGRHAFGGVSP